MDPIAAAVHEHEQGVAALRATLTATVAALRKDMDFSKRELHHLAEILVDDALLFRFFKKHKYQHKAAEQALLDHIDWRLQNDLPNLSTYSLTPKAHQLSQDGLFYFWKTDKEGRPFAVVNLKLLGKGSSAAADLEDLRMLFVVQMEVARRLVQDMNEDRSSASLPLIVQISVICDLGGVGLGNVNYEMIPLFLDLFNKHFPQTLGTVYVLNYGWLHSGIWSILKAALPADACRKLQFCSKAELLSKITPENLQDIHGGTDTAAFNYATSPVYSRFAHPNYHSTARRVLAHISALDDAAEDEGYHEDDVEVWYDAMETPMTPVRSAADLQSMLRVTSGRNLHGMNRVGSTKSLKSLSCARGNAGTVGLANAENYQQSNNGLMMRQLQAPPLPLTLTLPLSNNIPPTATSSPLSPSPLSLGHAASSSSPLAAGGAPPLPAALIAAAAAAGLSPLSQMTTSSIAAADAAAAAAAYHHHRVPGRRRALVRKTLANAVRTPARPLLSLLSRLAAAQQRDATIISDKTDATATATAEPPPSCCASPPQQVLQQQHSKRRKRRTLAAAAALLTTAVFAVALVHYYNASSSNSGSSRSFWKRRKLKLLERVYLLLGWERMMAGKNNHITASASASAPPPPPLAESGLVVVQESGERRKISSSSSSSSSPVSVVERRGITTPTVVKLCAASEVPAATASSSSSPLPVPSPASLSSRAAGGFMARLVAAAGGGGGGVRPLLPPPPPPPTQSQAPPPRDIGTVVSPLVAVAIGGALGIP
ncbi:hypothetical protein HDU86_004611 [Geranomyces michiganensis]|nr:hypothetical protein HDU86_004611 [Geranomyces michiganensis]